ncbi:MAG: M48 family metallopeptidase [Verrucomicrobiota bacterium]
MKRLKMRGSVAVAAIGLLGLLVLAGCITEPITGRRQLSLVAPAQEMQLGLSSFEQLKKETPISRDAAANALVQKVGQRIAAVADLPNAQWEFVVFDSPEANAFCLPGGKVGVYKGLLPVTKDEEGLATVIGHEVAHAAAHHGAERMSDAMALQAGGQALGLSLSKADPRTQALVQMAYGVGAQVGVLLPFSRTQESAADRIGLTYMARAGYNPEAAVAFWERFAEYGRRSGGAGMPGFLRTHPVDAVRIQQIKDWLPEARQGYRPQR